MLHDKSKGMSTSPYVSYGQVNEVVCKPTIWNNVYKRNSVSSKSLRYHSYSTRNKLKKYYASVHAVRNRDPNHTSCNECASKGIERRFHGDYGNKTLEILIIIL